uniref:Retrovirus-related Pol polyprotein from transposon TNT 1-94-like beta-barrel domain-containing protein n=1 Tax=Salix viminalis TaxID=40686 RepID=A0A6N2KDB8_SALVM
MRFSLIRAEKGRTVMLEATNTEGSAMMITNRKNSSDASRNLSDAMNGAEIVRTRGTKFSQDDQSYKEDMLETPWKTTKDGAYWRKQMELVKWRCTLSKFRRTCLCVHPRVRGFNRIKIESLRSLLKTMEKPYGSCSLAQNGKIPISHVFSASSQNHSSSWVIDSGAPDHMTYSTSAFKSYQTCTGSKKITVADGSGETTADRPLQNSRILHGDTYIMKFFLEAIRPNCKMEFQLLRWERHGIVPKYGAMQQKFDRIFWKEPRASILSLGKRNSNRYLV